MPPNTEIHIIILTHKNPAEIFKSFCKIGGENWLVYEYLDRETTSFLDRLFMGGGSPGEEEVYQA